MSLPEYSLTTEKQSYHHHEVLASDDKDLKAFDKPMFFSTPPHPLSVTSCFEPPSMRPGATLHISAHGVGLLRFPLPSSELEIPIFHDDGSLAYTSIRGKRSSGNAVLSHSKLGNVVSTTYSCGPGRAPVLRLLHGASGSNGDEGQIKIRGKWPSRSVWFEDVEGRVFSWGYDRTKDSNAKKVNTMVLRQQELSGCGGCCARRLGKTVALLIRSEETRAPGSSRSSAGNGGQLILDQDAASHLDEAVIVATCLVMLKKEVDRRRRMQTAVMVGVVAGAA